MESLTPQQERILAGRIIRLGQEILHAKRVVRRFKDRLSRVCRKTKSRYQDHLDSPLGKQLSRWKSRLKRLIREGSEDFPQITKTRKELAKPTLFEGIYVECNTRLYVQRLENRVSELEASNLKLESAVKQSAEECLKHSASIRDLTDENRRLNTALRFYDSESKIQSGIDPSLPAPSKKKSGKASRKRRSSQAKPVDPQSSTSASPVKPEVSLAKPEGKSDFELKAKLQTARILIATRKILEEMAGATRQPDSRPSSLLKRLRDTALGSRGIVDSWISSSYQYRHDACVTHACAVIQQIPFIFDK